MNSHRSEQIHEPEKIMDKKPAIPSAPRGLAMIAIIGPALVWCAEYIGSGEVILATRMGAILGYTALWAPIFGIILKTCIGIGGARYTVCTGEGMIDMFGRMPGPGKWAVWIVLFGQLFAGAISIGGVASAAGVFAHSLIPLKPFIWGWIVTLFAVAVVWSGRFNIMKYIMSVLVFIIVLGTLYISVHTFPGFDELIRGIFGFGVPEIPAWARDIGGVSSNPWHEILPLIGWAAGGFASQVWYTYWILGAGYGMAYKRCYGEPCDEAVLGSMSMDTARRVRGWCRMVYVDAGVAMTIGVVATTCFMLAGAGILKPEHIAPEGPTVAFELANVFGKLWGKTGATFFIISGLAALISTNIGQLAGWPRLLADSFRICIPAFGKRFSWPVQFRIFITFFMISNMLIVYTLGIEPVFVIKVSAVFEGLLFTPFQAVLVIAGLVWVLPRLLSREAWHILKPHWSLIAGLVIAAVVFGYFCIFKLV